MDHTWLKICLAEGNDARAAFFAIMLWRNNGGRLPVVDLSKMW